MTDRVIYSGSRSRFLKKFLPVAAVMAIIALLMYPLEKARHGDNHLVELPWYIMVVFLIIGIFGLGMYLQKEVLEMILHPSQKKITLTYTAFNKERTYSIPYSMLVLEYKVRSGKYSRNGRIRLTDGRQYFDITMMGNNLTSDKLDAVYEELRKVAAQVKV